MCLYALSGTDPLRPSVKRTEGLGSGPAGLDLAQLRHNSKARPRRGG